MSALVLGLGFVGAQISAPLIAGGYRATGTTTTPAKIGRTRERGIDAAVALVHALERGLMRVYNAVLDTKRRPANLTWLEVHLPCGALIIYNAHVPIDDGVMVSKYIGLRAFFKGPWADADANRRALKIFKQDQSVVGARRPAG